MADALTGAEGGALLAIADAAIADELRGARRAEPDLSGLGPRLSEPGASFATLELDGRLLGCVGSLDVVRPLGHDVARSVWLAAFEDPRLPPVGADEYEAMSIKLSVLSPIEELPAPSRGEVIAMLRPGIDGVLLEAGGTRATFLPSVWTTISDPDEFLGQLLRKAGLASDAWPPDARTSRYTTIDLIAPGPRRL